ncbi:hypothetical protein [Paraburkholderia heleia]|uniref:hypothetical protein n=1 Tax=Paraburkholderia heleia TaxID=634127 RepID=UPI0031D9BCDF
MSRNTQADAVARMCGSTMPCTTAKVEPSHMLSRTVARGISVTAKAEQPREVQIELHRLIPSAMMMRPMKLNA